MSVRPLTGDSATDRSRPALRLGTPVPLKRETLRRGCRAERLPRETRGA